MQIDRAVEYFAGGSFPFSRIARHDGTEESSLVNPVISQHRLDHIVLDFDGCEGRNDLELFIEPCTRPNEFCEGFAKWAGTPDFGRRLSNLLAGITKQDGFESILTLGEVLPIHHCERSFPEAVWDALQGVFANHSTRLCLSEFKLRTCRRQRTCIHVNHGSAGQPSPINPDTSFGQRRQILIELCSCQDDRLLHPDGSAVNAQVSDA